MQPRATPQRAETSCCAADRESVVSMPGRRILFGIEQPVQMDDEISHLRIVDRLLRLRLPYRVGGRVVGEQTDDFHLRKILERIVSEIVQFATEDEMQQLLRGTIWHDLCFLKLCPRRATNFKTRRGIPHGKG